MRTPDEILAELREARAMADALTVVAGQLQTLETQVRELRTRNSMRVYVLERELLALAEPPTANGCDQCSTHFSGAAGVPPGAEDRRR